MDPADLNPGELRLLLAVERTGSFTAAAVTRGLTQSAVSHAVRACERKIGVVLFHRGRTGARPTAAGQRALVHARQILRQLDMLAAEARGAATGTLTGSLRIAAFRSAATYLLPRAIDRLTARHPGLNPKVTIVPELGRGTAGEVANGHADVAIATLAEEALPPIGLIATELLREPYVLVLPTGRRNPLDLPLIDWAENCSSYTRAWWARQDWLPKVTFDVADDGVVLSMVAQGVGMAILPRLSLTNTPSSVVVNSLGDNPPIRRIVTVTTPATAQSVVVRELIANLRRVPRSDR